jgi:hypothetical protein
LSGELPVRNDRRGADQVRTSRRRGKVRPGLHRARRRRQRSMAPMVRSRIPRSASATRTEEAPTRQKYPREVESTLSEQPHVPGLNCHRCARSVPSSPPTKSRQYTEPRSCRHTPRTRRRSVHWSNTSLFGQSVARTEWQLTVPRASADPTNADVDLTKLEDIVLELTHEAMPTSGNDAIGGDLTCLDTVL